MLVDINLTLFSRITENQMRRLVFHRVMYLINILALIRVFLLINLLNLTIVQGGIVGLN